MSDYKLSVPQAIILIRILRGEEPAVPPTTRMALLRARLLQPVTVRLVAGRRRRVYQLTESGHEAISAPSPQRAAAERALANSAQLASSCVRTVP